MRPLAAALVPSLLLLSALPSQDAAALVDREAKLAQKAVTGLHALADALQAQRQHLRALELRRSIWQDYAENDDKAREKCGFVKVGDLWRKDDSRLVLDKDFKGDPKVMKKVDQDEATLKKELLAEHRTLAAGWTKAGDEAKAARHWLRVLRLQPGDKEAAAALAVQPFEGFRGTPAELAMLRRGRTIQGACDWLRRTAFPTAPTTGEHPLLAAAKISHVGVKSEHFEVWGTLPPADLATIAVECERGLLLARTLVGIHGGTVFVPKSHRNLVFVSKEQYAALLDQCADQFEAARLQFLKNDVDQAFVESAAGPLRLHRAYLGIEASVDQAVRGVVQDAIAVRTDGLYEGLGHAACGFLFGRTLTFLLEQQKARTVATWTQKALAPDLKVWMQIAEESAWAKSDTRTSELVLLSAAKFSTEQRVKAWAICHYLMHTRPEFLAELDQSQNKDIHTPPDVEQEFKRRTQIELPKIDHEWREFWGRGAELRKAIATDPVPDEKAPDRAAKLRARSLVDAVNAVRAGAECGPAGFFVSVGPEVQAVQHYDEQLLKAEAERKKKPKEPVALPSPPPELGRRVLWSRQKEAVAAVAEWFADPAMREALLHPGRELFGGSVYAGAWLCDVTSAAVPTQRGVPMCWPRDRQREVPADATAGALGTRAAAALLAAGKQPTDRVGMPITAHFLRGLAPEAAAKLRCQVWCGNHAVHGVLVDYGRAGTGAEAAFDMVDGLFAFLPLEPLPEKSEFEVRWEMPPGVLAKDEVFPAIQFTVR